MRTVTRLGGGALGRARARAALLLLLGLPGQVFLYQGEELGLEEVDVPDDKRQDPAFLHSGGRWKGRDGCRVPLPWRRGRPNAGFSTAEPWLPMPPGWDRVAVDVQAASGSSMLGHFRRALAERKRLAERLPDRVEWCPAPPGVLAYSRGRLTVVCNFSHKFARFELDGQNVKLAPNSAAWLSPVARRVLLESQPWP